MTGEFVTSWGDLKGKNTKVIQEGKMKNKRLFEFSAAAVAIVAAFVFVASTLDGPTPLSQLRPKPEKLCPITFHLDPVTSLQRNFAAHIEKTNAVLAQMLVNLRVAVLGTSEIKPSYDEKTWVNNFQNAFASTYLKSPVLWGDDGKTYPGWDTIVPYLKNTMPMTTYITPQSVNVYLEYLPLAVQKSPELLPRLKGINVHPEDIDFLAFVRTVLAYAPYDDPMEIGNEAPIPHRKICDPIF